ncbi:MAG: tRNA pseudouridine(13) synthase TruD [Spiribacter sp.]|nr:tRNA pseudouridine(13) synthase TruD [Spiribacter sp.]
MSEPTAGLTGPISPITPVNAWGAPLGQARVAASPEDFQVTEVLGYRADGEGPHLLVEIEKCGLSTADAMQQLARAWDCPRREMGYAGRKDRQAVTRQWLSVPWPVNAALPETGPIGEGLVVLSVERHRRKLRIGALQGNRFRLTLREANLDPGAVSSRLARMARCGVPNYFGPQRFGRGGRNLSAAVDWLTGGRRPRGRGDRSMQLSALRSEVFNRVLAARVLDGSWNQAIADDLMVLDGRGSLFPAREEPADSLARRMAGLHVHATGPLPGRRADALRLPAALADWEDKQTPCLAAAVDGLTAQGVDAARRALRLSVGELAWAWPAPQTLVITCRLPRGAYATTVLRELVTWLAPE